MIYTGYLRALVLNLSPELRQERLKDLINCVKLQSFFFTKTLLKALCTSCYIASGAHKVSFSFSDAKVDSWVQMMTLPNRFIH